MSAKVGLFSALGALSQRFPSHEVPPPQAIKAMLHEVMSQAPATDVIRDMMHETMGPIPLLPAPPVGARRPS